MHHELLTLPNCHVGFKIFLPPSLILDCLCELTSNMIITSNFQYALSPACLRKQTSQFLVAGVGAVPVDLLIVVVMHNIGGGIQHACNGFHQSRTWFCSSSGLCFLMLCSIFISFNFVLISRLVQNFWFSLVQQPNSLCSQLYTQRVTYTELRSCAINILPSWNNFHNHSWDWERGFIDASYWSFFHCIFRVVPDILGPGTKCKIRTYIWDGNNQDKKETCFS